MTSVFDGMTGVLNGVFGASVVYVPKSGPAQSVQAVFRSEPIEVSGADGHPVLIVAPTLRVQRSLLPGIRRGDRVIPSVASAQGKTFKVLNMIPTASPAGDAFLVCELEEDIT